MKVQIGIFKVQDNSKRNNKNLIKVQEGSRRFKKERTNKVKKGTRRLKTVHAGLFIKLRKGLTRF